MSARGSTRRKRTRRERLAALEMRRSWLVSKVGALREAGRPYSFLREELDALEWALPLLYRLVEAEEQAREQAASS